MTIKYDNVINEYDSAQRKFKFLISSMQSSRKYGIPFVISPLVGRANKEERILFIAQYLLSLVRTEYEEELIIDEDFKKHFEENESSLKTDATYIYQLAIENTAELANS